jgi:hypothetical protein
LRFSLVCSFLELSAENKKKRLSAMPGFPSASQTVAFIRKNGVKSTGAAVSRSSLGFRGGGASPAVYTCKSLFPYLDIEYLIEDYLTKSKLFCEEECTFGAAKSTQGR